MDHTSDPKKDLESHTREIRKVVLSMIHKAGTSHIGSNLSCIDILTVLYDRILDITPELNEDRDRFILSKGWASAALYKCLADKGIIPIEDLERFGKEPYLGLVERSVRGIEASTGAMGHGLPISISMALGFKRANTQQRVYVLMSDGEMNCGTTWESALLASHHQLNNLTVIVDVNGWQAMGRTEEVLNTDSLEEKWKAFGWEVIVCPGHDLEILEFELRKRHERPFVILAHTTKGKGCSILEDKLEWHYRQVDDNTFNVCLSELKDFKKGIVLGKSLPKDIALTGHKKVGTN